MDTKEKHNSDTPASDLDTGRSQLVFMAVGVSIILGGLWLLYSADGPYHPGETEADAHFQVSNDS